MWFPYMFPVHKEGDCGKNANSNTNYGENVFAFYNGHYTCIYSNVRLTTETKSGNRVQGVLLCSRSPCTSMTLYQEENPETPLES